MNTEVQLAPNRTERALGFAVTAYQRYRSVFNHAIEGIFQMTPDGRYLAANPALARIYGYDTPEELQEQLSVLGAHFYVKPDRRAEFMQRMKTEGIVTDFESEIFRKDGAVVWISENAVTVRDEAGRALSYEGFVIDITERKLASQELNKTRGDLEASMAELREAQARVAETERLRTLGAMVNGVAHEFNNALWMILGYGELLQQLSRSQTVSPEFSEYSGTIVKAALDAVEVVARLGDFHRPAGLPESKEPFALNEVVQRALNFTRPRWQTESSARGTPIEIETKFGVIDPLVGNAAEFREMLTHLIFNSLEAMPQGGTISLETRAVDGKIQLAVSDTGQGMTTEVRRRCLEPFFTTKGGRSTGVGLAVVYGIVERHGGTLKIESTPGRGAKFTFSFPVGNAAAATENRVPAQCCRPLHILAVDDHPVQTELLAHALQRDWHIVATATNGRDALEKFDAEYFDLVITDKAMPEMNGDQLAAAIKSREPSTPIIMLTGLGQLDADEDLSEFVDMLLPKPATLKDLRAAIAKVMA